MTKIAFRIAGVTTAEEDQEGVREMNRSVKSGESGRMRGVALGAVLASILCLVIPSVGMADNPLHGRNAADTIVYGDILFKDSNTHECVNEGPGICIWNYTSTSPYRGTYYTYLSFDDDTWLYLYGDQATGDTAGDYIYPADLLDASPIACTGERWISIDGSLSGCSGGTSAVAAFNHHMSIAGDQGSPYTGSADRIWGWDLTDVVTGNGGNDYVYGGGGSDLIGGGDGNDYLYGGYVWNDDSCGTGYEYIYGGADNDHIYGCDADNDEDDVLAGEGGADVLVGLDGDDYLDGGDGADVLYGGAGADDELYGRGDYDCLSDDDVAVCNCGGDSPSDAEDCPGDGTGCYSHVSVCYSSP